MISDRGARSALLLTVAISTIIRRAYLPSCSSIVLFIAELQFPSKLDELTAAEDDVSALYTACMY